MEALLQITPLIIFTAGMAIPSVRELYKGCFRTVKDGIITTYTGSKLLLKGCISGEYKFDAIGMLKDYILNKMRASASHYLNLGRLVYDPQTKLYTLTYFKGSSEFDIVFKRSARGPRRARHFYNEIDVDVTTDVIKKLGVTKDFHQIPTTPEMLGIASLRIVYNNGLHRTFSKNEVVCLHNLYKGSTQGLNCHD